MGTRQGTRTSWAGAAVGLVLLLLVTACGVDAPLSPVTVTTASAESRTAADALVHVLADAERALVHGDASTGRPGTDPEVGQTVAAFGRAQADALTRAWPSADDRPTRSSVALDDVRAGTDADGDACAVVTVTTTRGFTAGPDALARVGYVVRWSTTASGGIVLSDVRALHDDGGPAEDRGRGARSALAAAQTYSDALVRGAGDDLDHLEGAVRSAPDLRAELRTRLLGHPPVVVEVPEARDDSTQVLYAVQPESDALVRLEVDMTESPVVTALL